MKGLRINIYLTSTAKEKGNKLAALLGLPFSRLLGFLIDYYIRKEKINLD